MFEHVLLILQKEISKSRHYIKLLQQVCYNTPRHIPLVPTSILEEENKQKLLARLGVIQSTQSCCFQAIPEINSFIIRKAKI